MSVVAIIITSLYHLYVSLCNTWLLGKLLLEEVGYEVEVAREQPTNETKGKHVTTLQHRLVVHARVGQAGFHHLRHGAAHHAVGVNAHLAEIVCRLELCLVKVALCKRVCIDNDSSPWLCILILSLECRSIHSHEHVALVAWGIYLTCTDVNLETRHTRQRTLRSTYVGWIVRKCRNTVTHGSRYRRKDISGELHAITGVT